MTSTPGTAPGTPPGGQSRLRRRAGTAAVAALLLAGIPVGAAVSADAGTPKTATGPQGQKLTVSATTGLDPAQQKVRVRGEGYGLTTGIYVALCKDNGENRVPSPCLGGADMSGASKTSQWIVPPGDPYEGDLAQAFGPGGTFDVEIEIAQKGDGLDCAEVACSVVTRADHRAAGDRTQDVRIPVAFAGQDPGDGGGEGVDVPAGTVSYKSAADFTTAGKPLDLLLHPDSKKLYVGADNLPDTADVDERGLHVLNPENGASESWISQAPGSTGALRASAAARIAGPLPGDGVVYNYPLRGVGSAKSGDEAATGVWLAGSTITDIAPGTTPDTVLVAQGATLSEIERATGTATRSLTLPGGTQFAADPERKALWYTDFTAGKLHRVDLASFTVSGSFDLPGGPGGMAGFTETDPATGAVWVGVGRSVLVFDAAGTLVKTLLGKDLARDAAFDTASGRAYVVWQDGGDLSDPANDNNGTLTVYGTEDFAVAAQDLSLPGNHSQAGAASLAVEPGGATVFVTSPAEGKITKLVRQVSPLVTRAPADLTAKEDEEVALTAEAEGTPEPTVRWQVSTDGAQTWKDVEGATESALTFTARTAQDGYRYRAEFRNDVGTTRTAAVTLTVTAATGGDTGGDVGGNGDASNGAGSTGSDGSTGGDGGDGTQSSGGSTTGDSDSTGGSGSTGTSAGSTGTSDGSGATVGGGVAGGTGTAATSGGGSLAATGATVMSVTLAAAGLVGAGVLVHRRARRRTEGAL
ncbi:hypothetical protein [Streptomyces rubiginosohelvolus]|uniref:hypothetical protein n=1 Tax=Streptomyces rubiginosohelvolus TaxID=67362 RepID=UPI00368BEEC6